jgi:hypothetical protein
MSFPLDRSILLRWSSALALLLAVGFAQAALAGSQGPGAAPAPAQALASPPARLTKTLSESDSKRVVELDNAIGAL